MSASVRCGIQGCRCVALDVFEGTPLCAKCIAYMASMNSENAAALHELVERHFVSCRWCGYRNRRGVLACAHCGWRVDRMVRVWGKGKNTLMGTDNSAPEEGFQGAFCSNGLPLAIENKE